MQGVYHVWFSTKGRRAVLDGEIGTDVRHLLIQVARGSNIDLLEMEAASDHVHLLVRLAAAHTLSSVMHQLKGASARAIFLKYPDLKMDLGHHAFWQKGYGFRRVDPEQMAATRQYVRTQTSRPLRHDAG